MQSNVDELEYIRKIVSVDFKIIISSVAAYGLDESWLGRLIDDEAIDELVKLNEKIQDRGVRVRIEAPEMFRVMGKRKPQCVKPYLEKLQWFAYNDTNPVVRIHSAGAVRITKKALEEIKNATDK